MQTKRSEIWVGAFMLIALCAILFLCLKVANISSLGTEQTYRVYATFDNIGGLKKGSPVKVGGVMVGRVSAIALDKNYLPLVTMDINKQYDQIPDTSSLAIRTAGLLGEQYLALNIGFSDPDMGTAMLKESSKIQDTKSAMVLEDLIGQFLYKSGGKNDTDKPADAAAASKAETSAPVTNSVAPSH